MLAFASHSAILPRNGRALAGLAAFAALLAGCGADEGLFGSKSAGTGSGTSGTTTGTAGGGGSGQGGAAAQGGGGAAPKGPRIRIHMSADTKPFAHDDGLSGQTPISHSSGLRKFELYRDDNDPSPLVVFDYGTGFVEAGYNDGDDTIAATVDPTTLTEGHYTRGRVVHSHVRYSIHATMHAQGYDFAGTFDNVEVLSDKTLLDGTLRDHGYYDYVFNAAGKSYPVTGENAPVPTYPGSGGFSVTFTNGQWAYWFPVDLTVKHDLSADVDVDMHVNMFESFRWQDQGAKGYKKGVFDVTPASFEPVERFGANSFVVSAK